MIGAIAESRVHDRNSKSHRADAATRKWRRRQLVARYFRWAVALSWTKYELVINLKTAKAHGRAEEVIE